MACNEGGDSPHLPPEAAAALPKPNPPGTPSPRASPPPFPSTGTPWWPYVCACPQPLQPMAEVTPCRKNRKADNVVLIGPAQPFQVLTPLRGWGGSACSHKDGALRAAGPRAHTQRCEKEQHCRGRRRRRLPGVLFTNNKKQNKYKKGS